MFTVVGKKITESEAMIIIEPNLKGNKLSSKNKTPLSDLNARIRCRLQSIGLTKNNASEITFRGFSIDRLDVIRRKYDYDTGITDIFNILGRKYYDPACVILEEVPLKYNSKFEEKDTNFSENDFEFVIISLLGRVEFTENFKLLVLRNFDQKYLEALSNIKFPDRLNLRVEHVNKNMLEKLQNIKLQATKINFFIADLNMAYEKSNNNNKFKAVPYSSYRSEYIFGTKTAEETFAIESEHNLNSENIIWNSQINSNEQYYNNSYIELESLEFINHDSDFSLSNQLVNNVTSEAETSDVFIDTLTIIKTIASEAETTQSFFNHTFPELLSLIIFVANTAIAKAKYEQNTQELKKQIDVLNEQIQKKAVEQEKVRILEEEINFLKQEIARLQVDLKNVVSVNQYELAPYILESSQLRQKNQQLVYEIEDLKLKLSKQESSNKRKLTDEREFESNKKQRVREHDTIHNNNLSPNSPVGSVTTDNNLVSRSSRNASFFSRSTGMTTPSNIYSSPTKQTFNNS